MPRINVEFGGSTTGLNAALANVEKRLATLESKGTRAGKKVSKSFIDLGKTWQRTQQRLAKGVTGLTRNFVKLGATIGGLVSAGGLAVATKRAIEFETAVANVGTLLGDAIPLLKDYEAGLKEISKTTSKDLVDLTAGLYDAISAGAGSATDAGQALNFLAQAQKAAVAGLATTKDSVRAGVTALNVFGETAGSIDVIYDKFFQTIRDGVTTFPEIAGSLGNMITAAKNAGVEFDAMQAGLVRLTKAGVGTSEASTQLRQLFLALAAPTKRVQNRLDKLGVSLSVERIKAEGLASVLTDLRDATGGNLQVLRSMLGSVEALNAALVISENNGQEFVEQQERIANATGTTTEAFELQRKTVAFQLGQLRNKFQVVVNEIVKKLAPLMIEEMEKLGKSIDDLDVEELAKDVKEVGKAFATLGRVLSRIVGFFGDMADATERWAENAARGWLFLTDTGPAVNRRAGAMERRAMALEARADQLMGGRSPFRRTTDRRGGGMDPAAAAAAEAARIDAENRAQLGGDIPSALQRPARIDNIVQEAQTRIEDFVAGVPVGIAREREEQFGPIARPTDEQLAAEAERRRKAERAGKIFKGGDGLGEDELTPAQQAEVEAAEDLRMEQEASAAVEELKAGLLQRQLDIEKAIAEANRQRHLQGADERLAELDAVQAIKDEYNRVVEETMKATTLWDGFFTLVKQGGIGAAFEGLDNTLQDKFDTAVMKMQGFLNNLTLDDVIGGALDLLQSGLEAAGSAFGALLKGAGAVLLGVGAGLAAKFGGLVSFAGATQAERSINIKGEETAPGFRSALASRFEETEKFIDQLVANLPVLFDMLVPFIDRITKQIIEAIPLIVDAFVQGMPQVIQALARNLGPLLDAVIEQIPTVINEIVAQLPVIVRAFLREVVPRIPDLTFAVVEGFIDAFTNNIDEFIVQLVRGLAVAFEKLVDKLNPFSFEGGAGGLAKRAGKAIITGGASEIPIVGDALDKILPFKTGGIVPPLQSFAEGGIVAQSRRVQQMIAQIRDGGVPVMAHAGEAILPADVTQQLFGEGAGQAAPTHVVIEFAKGTGDRFDRLIEEAVVARIRKEGGNVNSLIDIMREGRFVNYPRPFGFK